MKKNGKIKFDPKNARRHGDANKQMIRESLQEVGAFRSIALDGNNIVRAGNGVYEQAQALGYKVKVIDAKPNELIAVRRLDLKGKKAIRAALYDNRTGELSDWDAAILSEMAEQDKELLAGIFDDKALAEFAVETLPEENDDEHAGELVDKAEELQKKWKVKLGDIWQCGRHKIACGDSSDGELTANLIRKTKIDGVCTDPPFDLDVEYIQRILGLFANSAIVMCGDKQAMELAQFWHFCILFVWHRKQARLNGSIYMPVNVHTLCIAIKRKPGIKLGWKAQADGFKSVIECEHDYVDNEMGHGKHSEVFEKMLHGFTAWKNIADPFFGTGATMLACEKIKRTCYGVELNPKTLAVALERWVRANPSAQPKRI